MSGSSVPAVCLGAGYGGRTLLGVVRSLGRQGVPVTAVSAGSDPPARFSRYCRFVAAPSPEADPAALESLLLDLAAGSRFDKPVLLPVGDDELAFVAERAEWLSRHFRLHVPPAPTMAAVSCKRAQYEAASRLGVAIPRTYFDLTARRVAATAINYPVVIKPSVSAHWPLGRCKGLQAHDAGELASVLSAFEAAGSDVVVQSIVPGLPTDCFTVHLYIGRDGRPHTWGTLRKYRQYPEGFGLATLMESVSLPELESASITFLQTLGFTGPAGIEFKRDPRDGVFRMIEINPRFELQTQLAASAGADVPWAMYRDLTGLTALPRTRYRTGIRWVAFNLDVKASLGLCRRAELSPVDWAKSMARVRTASLLTWDDPVPAVWATLSPILNILRKTLGGKHAFPTSTAPAAARGPLAVSSADSGRDNLAVPTLPHHVCRDHRERG